MSKRVLLRTREFLESFSSRGIASARESECYRFLEKYQNAPFHMTELEEKGCHFSSGFHFHPMLDVSNASGTASAQDYALTLIHELPTWV